MKYPSLRYRLVYKVFSPWQEERGERYGNNRKQVARLKKVERRQNKKKEERFWKLEHSI